MSDAVYKEFEVYIFEDLWKFLYLVQQCYYASFSWMASNHEIHENLNPSKFTTHTVYF